SSQRRGLMHDRIRPAAQHGRAHGPRVQQVEPDRFGAERLHQLRAGRRVVGADHFVPGVDQLRYETASQRAAGPGNEDSHRVFLSLAFMGVPWGDTSGAGDVTRAGQRDQRYAEPPRGPVTSAGAGGSVWMTAMAGLPG